MSIMLRSEHCTWFKILKIKRGGWLQPPPFGENKSTELYNRDPSLSLTLSITQQIIQGSISSWQMKSLARLISGLLFKKSSNPVPSLLVLSKISSSSSTKRTLSNRWHSDHHFFHLGKIRKGDGDTKNCAFGGEGLRCNHCCDKARSILFCICSGKPPSIIEASLVIYHQLRAFCWVMHEETESQILL